jgi:hypothetical protein
MSECKTVSLHEVFLGLQKEMFQRMKTVRKTIEHAPSMGDEGEAEWIELFQHFLPKRYQADKAFVVDSNGRISEQMDIVIFDRQYSPFLAKLKKCHYIPAESVYAVLEVKQDLTAAHIDYAGGKAASVRALHRTTMPIRHAGGTFKPREHFNILAGLLCHASGWKPAFGKPFATAMNEREVAKRLDCGCCLEAGSFFTSWETGLPISRVSDKDTSLVSFVLGIIHALQALGTVPALDMNAYLSPLLEATLRTKDKSRRKTPGQHKSHRGA